MTCGADPATRSDTKAKKLRTMRRTAVVGVILLAALSILVSAAAAQKDKKPDLPDQAANQTPPSFNMESDSENGAPEVLRPFFIILESNCSFGPLDSGLRELMAAGKLKEAPILNGNELYIVIEEAYLNDLSSLPCVQEIVRDRSEMQEASKPAASEWGPYNQGAPLDGSTAAEATGAVSGAVTAEDGGLPLPDITVELYNYPGPDSGWTLFSSDETATDGTFSIGGLPAGMYRVGFFDWLSGTFVGEFFDNVFNLNIASNVPVADGATTRGINAALSRPSQISGTVREAAGGDRLQGITVHAYKQNASGWEWINSDTTLADGTYIIDDLPSGVYQVQFVDSGGLYLEQFFEGVYFRQDSDDVLVSGGAETASIDASLVFAGHIAGTVTAEDGGLPLSDIEVCALVFKDAHWETLSCAQTDGGGEYDVGNLPAGTYRVAFNDQKGDYAGEYYDNALILSEAVDITVTAGSTTQDIDAALASAGHILGTVTAEESGAPLKDIKVCALSFRSFDWRAIICGYTDDGGRYDLGFLQTAAYRVEFQDEIGNYADEYFSDAPDVSRASDVTVTAGERVENIDAAMARFGRISGMVTAEADGSALADINVCARYLGLYSTARSRCSFTNASGGYVIDDLYPGTYNVSFFDQSNNFVREYYNNQQQATNLTPVSVIGAQTTSGINAALTRYGLIRGQVTAEDGGTPLPSIYVYAYVNGSDKWVYAGRGDTDANGNYEIGPLVTGNYRVEFFDASGNYMKEYYNDALAPDLARTVSVTPGSISEGINAALGLAVTQDIPLSAGWNMISSYIRPGEAALETLFRDIEHDVVLVKNGDGRVYWPSLRINQIGDWNARHGYLIYMENPAMLSIEGAIIQPDQMPLELTVGWNLAAYLRSSPMPAEQALATIDGQLYLAKNGAGESYWPALTINQIGDMHPGEGYQLYMNESGLLIYPGN